MYIRSRLPLPGIRARTPIWSGDLAVSHTFTVAQRSGGRPASAAGAAKARGQTAATGARLTCVIDVDTGGWLLAGGVGPPYFLTSRSRHARSVSAFLLTRSSDLLTRSVEHD